MSFKSYTKVKAIKEREIEINKTKSTIKYYEELLKKREAIIVKMKEFLKKEKEILAKLEGEKMEG